MTSIATKTINVIGDKIFNYLPIEDVFNCRKVNKQCKIILDDPIFLLKLLKAFGHPEECHKKWINLLQNCQERGISKKVFTTMLLQKIWNSSKLIPKTKNPKLFQKWQLTMPPIYNTTKKGCFDVVKVIAELDKDFFKPLKHWKKRIKWRPFNEAAINGHFEIAEFIDSRIQTQKLSKQAERAMWFSRSRCMYLAMSSKSNEIVKFLALHIKNPLSYMKHQKTAIHFAAEIGDIELLEFFLEYTDNVHTIVPYGFSGYEMTSNIVTVVLERIEDGFEYCHNIINVILLT